ncbi:MULTISPECIES: Uma2 family endonuclease [unclassified Chamaesiphon]|uniref:Uma2 family endonuclease n=1 Tax=unclassified Chamaesiphon TaxID=2620921 RepID=UPI00286A6185|nr:MULTISPECIES: Uma2 family endonuclease [unclassified Chamaesiphon]
MVALKEDFPHFTPAEYLAWEEQQEFRHEYVDGEVYAMTGGTINHSKIAVNFSTALKNHLRGSGCQVLNGDAKVQTIESNSYCYPDVSVTCDIRDRGADRFITHPCLIVEVLSPSTEAYDRGDKFRLYRRSPDLQEYVLVSTAGIYVDVYQRNDRNRWELMSYGEGDEIELKSINYTFTIAQIYEDIAFNLE